LDKLRKWSGILQRQGLDIFQDEVSSCSFISLASLYPNLLQLALACGLKPNGVLYRSLDSSSSFRTPISLFLEDVFTSRGQSLGQRQLAIDNVVVLIRAGADIYQIWRKRELCPSCGAPGESMTPTVYAMRMGIKSQWAVALLDCGYDPEKVFAEDARRRREFLRTRGAKCTGVEISSGTIEESSEVRLRSRRVFKVED
jgi:hypothetical protein